MFISRVDNVIIGGGMNAVGLVTTGTEGAPNERMPELTAPPPVLDPREPISARGRNRIPNVYAIIRYSTSPLCT